MQQGLAFLWLLAVGTACAVWLYVEFSLRRQGTSGHRRRLSGCELARQILDRHGFKRVQVTAVPTSERAHGGHRWEELFLSEKVYSGTTLGDLTLALHDTMHLLEEPRTMIPSEVRLGLKQISQWVVAVSWLLVAAGSLFPRAGGALRAGQSLFVLVFFLALISFPEEWRVTERARGVLLHLEGFEVGERAKISQMLGVLQGLPAAQILHLPFWKWRTEI